MGIDGEWVLAHLQRPSGPFTWCKWPLPWWRIRASTSWPAMPRTPLVPAGGWNRTGTTRGWVANMVQPVSVTVE